MRTGRGRDIEGVWFSLVFVVGVYFPQIRFKCQWGESQRVTLPEVERVNYSISS